RRVLRIAEPLRFARSSGQRGTGILRSGRDQPQGAEALDLPVAVQLRVVEGGQKARPRDRVTAGARGSRVERPALLAAPSRRAAVDDGERLLRAGGSDEKGVRLIVVPRVGVALPVPPLEVENPRLDPA